MGKTQSCIWRAQIASEWWAVFGPTSTFQSLVLPWRADGKLIQIQLPEHSNSSARASRKTNTAIKQLSGDAYKDSDVFTWSLNSRFLFLEGLRHPFETILLD